MKVRLDTIHEDEPLVWEENLSLPAEQLGLPELLGLSAVGCRGSLQWTEAGYLLRMELNYAQTLACDRCLAEKHQNTRASLDLMIESAKGHSPEAEVELQEDDFGILHLEGDVLDTEPLVQEQLLLNIPMKPLCRPDCKGLCPRCGADLNTASCVCSSKDVDPRWAALAALRDQLP